MTGQVHFLATSAAASSRPAGAVTLHTRIRDELRERIAAGSWRPLDRIPSESMLMRQYGVSRPTVRQALGELEHERLIFRVAGKGSFVAQNRPFQELDRLQGFAEAMRALGHATVNRVVGLQRLPAPQRVAERLGLARGAPVTEIQRVRHADGAPVSLDVTWLPAELGERVARADLATRDIFTVLERDCGLALGHADLAIDAMPADARLAGLLGIAPGAAVLRVERLTHARDGTPLDYEHLFCRGDNFQYRLRVHRGPIGT
ncbi:MAG: GntR family transcriptional regulator [Pseudomonadota bacterium]